MKKRAVFLVSFALLLTACTMQDGRIYLGARATSTGQQDAILATPVLRVKDDASAPNDAFLMGENQAPQASATAGPNLQATIDFLERKQIVVTENARKDGMLIAKYTQDQQAVVNAGAVASQTAQHPAQTATKAAESTENAQQSARFTQSAAILTATWAAPDLQSRQQKAATDARWGWVYPVAALLTPFVLVAFAVLFFVALRSPHVEQVAEQAEEKRDYPGTAFHPVIPVGTTLVRRETPPGWTDEEMILFALNVRTSRNKTGIPFTRAWWVDKNGMPDKRWDSLNIYCFEHGYILAATDAANSTASFTPDGERYLLLFQSSPLPPTQENPISADLSSNSPPG